jgi:transglutaminase-like putative cysteine protease
MIAGEDHVVVAWGRDYDDVSPIRGVVLGGGEHHVKVAVDVDPCRG